MSMDDTTNGRSPSESRPTPTLEGRVSLATALDLERAGHPVDAGTLGEYVELLDRSGLAAAREAFPAVAAHLAAGCDACNADVRELRELAVLADLGDLDHGSSEAFRPRTTASSTDHPFGTTRGVLGGIAAPAEPATAPSRREPRALVVGLLAVAAVALVVMGGALLTLLTAAQRGGTGEIKLIERGSETPVSAATSPHQLAPPTLTGTAPSISAPNAASTVGQLSTPVSGPTPPASATPAAAGATPSASPAEPTGTVGSVASNTGECSDPTPIKANRDSRIYHLRGGQFYERTRAELCFATTEDAKRAGYRRSQR